MSGIQPVGLSPAVMPEPGDQRLPARRRGRRGRSRLQTLTRRDKVVLGVMVGIPTLIQAVLVWLPTLFSIILSFTKWDGLSLGSIKFAGLANYNFVFFQSPAFWPAILHNIVWLLFLAIVGTPLGLFLAVLLDQPIRGSRIYQSIFFMPVMLSVALIGIIWDLIYSQDNGLINNVLGTAGTSAAVDWFGNSSLNLWAALVAATWRHSGYIMILYLAGLKGVDPSLKEAASLDGANARQIFFRVVFPAMAPTNVIIIVITIIESLRAFDIVYVINRATNGLELVSALVVSYLVGEGQVIGIGSAFAVVLLVISLVPIVIYLSRTFSNKEVEHERNHLGGDPRGRSTSITGVAVKKRSKQRHPGIHAVLIVLAALWLIPLLWAVYTSLRPKADTDKYGYFSVAGRFDFQNFIDAWTQGGFPQYILNSVLIVVPTVVLTLFFASMMAFAVSRFSWRFNVTLLIAFTAGNLLPPQVLAAPLFEMFKLTVLPYSISDSGSLLNQLVGVIIVNTAFQIGFCTFVLSNYMKALPMELSEAARVDGAGVWRQYYGVVMPLTRPALAALGTLEVIFIYNDYFWPLILIQSGNRLPITTAINNLQGEFLSNYNLLAAGAVIIVIPTLIIYLALQRQFIAGLTLGANKG